MWRISSQTLQEEEGESMLDMRRNWCREPTMSSTLDMQTREKETKSLPPEVKHLDGKTVTVHLDRSCDRKGVLEHGVKTLKIWAQESKKSFLPLWAERKTNVSKCANVSTAHKHIWGPERFLWSFKEKGGPQGDETQEADTDMLCVSDLNSDTNGRSTRYW